MAGKKSYGGRWRRPRLLQEWALGALATDTLVSEGGGTATDQEAIVTSIEVTVARNNGTQGEGPILVGVAHSDYTDAEIEQCVEALGAWTSADKIAEEQSKRLVRMLGTFAGDATEKLWDGRKRKFKLNWRIADGQAINFWAYNSDSAVLTTGSAVNVDGYANLKLV